MYNASIPQYRNELKAKQMFVHEFPEGYILDNTVPYVNPKAQFICNNNAVSVRTGQK